MLGQLFQLDVDVHVIALLTPCLLGTCAKVI